MVLCFTSVAGYTNATEKGERSLKREDYQEKAQCGFYYVVLQKKNTYAIVLGIFRSNPKTLQIV